MYDDAFVKKIHLIVGNQRNNAIFVRYFKNLYRRTMKRLSNLFIIIALALAAISCEQTPQGGNKAPIVIYDGPVDLADQGFGMYYGNLSNNSVGVYTVVLSDAVCFRDGYGTPYLDSEGDMLVLEFNTELQEDSERIMIPEGRYEIAVTKSGAMTINTKKSYLKKLVGNTQYHYDLVSGVIVLAYNNEGGYEIMTEDLVVARGKDRHEVEYSYSGTLKFDDWRKVAAGLQGVRDDIVDMPFSEVSAVYYGNLFGYGTANYVISFSTAGFIEDDSATLPGVMVVMNMFDELPSGDEIICLTPGTYTVYPSFNAKEFSMLYGMNMDGVPFGTYIYQVDAKGEQALEFISQGTVEVKKLSHEESGEYNDVYTFEYELKTPSRKIAGSWTGVLEFADASTDNDRVILSTLEDDVECDMSKVERAYLDHVETLHTTSFDNSEDIAEAWQMWLQPRMWTEEEKKLDWDDRIAAWDPNGDIMILEFVVPLGSKGDIAPELNKEYKYTIQPNLTIGELLYEVSVSKMGRPYDDIFYAPNWDDYYYMTGTDSRRGFTWDGGYRGNWYLHYMEGTWQNMDEHAPAVKGTVTVTRTTEYSVATGGGREAHFDIVWDLYDDTEASNNITGSWSGPVTLGVAAPEVE